MQYNVRYEDITINTNQQAFDPTGASSITFENYGDEDAIINQNIKLDQGTSIDFPNEPYEIIKSTFKIQFSGLGVNPNVQVIKKFSTKTTK